MASPAPQVTDSTLPTPSSTTTTTTMAQTPSTPPVRIAVAGAGLIGKRHIDEVSASPHATLCAIVDPSPSDIPASIAAAHSVPLFASLEALFASPSRPDGVILATPNSLHLAGGLACVAAGIPVIVEKPLADTVAGARQLVDTAAAAGVPLLTGHHRNYSALMARTRELLAAGTIGRPVAVTGTALFYKPDAYFDENGGWRKNAGGGPILLNLSHEVNSLLSLLGPVSGVQAVTSSATRVFDVEDTAALVLRFKSGALGTFMLSDTAASARSWEQTSGENKSYAHYPDEDCYHIAGTRGSVSVPTMRVRTYPGGGDERSWWKPFETSEEGLGEGEDEDPLAAQVRHFARVIRGEAKPICSGQDGLATMQVVEAVLESARTGKMVEIEA